MYFSNYKRKQKIAESWMDQKPETYTKCIGEINTLNQLIN